MIATLAMTVFPGGGGVNTFILILVMFKFYGYVFFAVLLLPNKLPKFDGWDCQNGLGITVHDTFATRIFLD